MLKRLFLASLLSGNLRSMQNSAQISSKTVCEKLMCGYPIDCVQNRVMEAPTSRKSYNSLERSESFLEVTDQPAYRFVSDICSLKVSMGMHNRVSLDKQVAVMDDPRASELKPSDLAKTKAFRKPVVLVNAVNMSSNERCKFFSDYYGAL